ncbi:MAG: hypothetical protein LBV33_02270 [Lachnospiraceae bacterium]|jgi:cytochrome oxidase Cu insertion factor (SCO1/SenC/PrrC family)|nr:hypothetical protein [Lachnospiraceae bacterium]
MLDSMELNKMSQLDLREINPDDLVNADNITVDPSLPQMERIEQYLEQIHNPYCFMSGDTPVRVCFAETEKTLSGALIDYFIRLSKK